MTSGLLFGYRPCRPICCGTHRVRIPKTAMVLPGVQPFFHAIVIAAVLALAGLCGCAGTRAVRDIGPDRVGPAAAVSHGTIIAMRNVVLPSPYPGLGVLGEVLLAGAADRPGSPAAPRAPEVEFIVRQDDGRTISVVQGDTNHFLAGQHVTIVHGARTRLAPG